MNKTLKPLGPEQDYVVNRKDLPLCCPNAQTELWSAHPRVYLPIEKTGQATCPYCGAAYTLTPE